MTDLEALLVAIEADPFEQTPRFALADYLYEQNGDEGFEFSEVVRAYCPTLFKWEDGIPFDLNDDASPYRAFRIQDKVPGWGNPRVAMKIEVGKGFAVDVVDMNVTVGGESPVTIELLSKYHRLASYILAPKYTMQISGQCICNSEMIIKLSLVGVRDVSIVVTALKVSALHHPL